jgi:hypothetical protein
MLSSTQYPQRFLDLYNLAKDLSQHHHLNLERTFDNILEVENPQLTIMGIRGALSKKGFFLNKEESQPLSGREEQRQMTVLYQKYQNKRQIPKDQVSSSQKDIGDEILVILEQMQQRLELDHLKNIQELEGRLKKEFQQGKQEGVEIQQFIDFQETFEKKFAIFDQRVKSIQTKLDMKAQGQDIIEEMSEKIESLEHRLKEEERKKTKKWNVDMRSFWRDLMNSKSLSVLKIANGKINSNDWKN